MKAFFFGIYELGIASLTRLLDSGVRIVGIATKLEEGPHLRQLGDIARRRRIPFFASAGTVEPELTSLVQSLRPDLIIVSGYHRLVPTSLLTLAGLGGVNLHPSLLPAYRGPCPWKWVIVRGERRTGVTVHEMDAAFDTGRILSQEALEIHRDETGGELFQRLCDIGGHLLVRTVRALQTGRLKPRPQDPSLATYFGAPTDRDTRIVWTADGETIRNLVRGFHPRPGAWTAVNGERLRIDRASMLESQDGDAPGTILGVTRDGLVVATGGGVVHVTSPDLDGTLRPGQVLE
jgi:methionyl-tRNA formyltransferase